MTPSPIKLAVLGAGHLGKFHARLAASLEEFEVVAVADPVEGAREALAAEVNALPVADPEQAIGLADAVVIATPTHTHHALASLALGAGRHALVEKPLTPSAAEAADLVGQARRAGLTLQVGHVERFNPAIRAAVGSLGSPRFLRATRTSGYSFRSTDIGVVLDLMIHDIDLALWLVGSPVRDVHALGASVLGGHEDLATAQLTFENGCVAQLTASRCSYAMERSLQVFSDSGFTSFDLATRRTTHVEPRPEVLAGGYSVASLSAAERERLRTGLFEDLLRKREVETPATNAIQEELRDFAAAVRTGQSPQVSGADGLAAVEVAERVLRSLARHAWDGDASGRVGPFFERPAAVIPASHAWPATRPERRAG